MSYHTEHLRLKPVLDLARQLDIATNPEAKAIFEAGNGGFQVWCTPYDHPQGWNGIQWFPERSPNPASMLAVRLGNGMTKGLWPSK
jgi:hypothetical protein